MSGVMLWVIAPVEVKGVAMRSYFLSCDHGRTQYHVAAAMAPENDMEVLSELIVRHRADYRAKHRKVCACQPQHLRPDGLAYRPETDDEDEEPPRYDA